MSFRKFSFALAVFCSSSVLARQQCYWPDGSILSPSQGYWVNCYSSQESTCCLNGDVCLSNGLCYGAALGQVRPPRSLPNSSRTLTPQQRHTEVHAQSKNGVTQPHVQLSGEMTVKDLTTANLWSSLRPLVSAQ